MSESNSNKVRVRVWPGFDEALARLQRKYPRINQDIAAAFEDGLVGRVDALPGYSHKLWKIRVASRDMGRGKRGGFRIIFYRTPDFSKPLEEVHLLTIYAKSERADIPADQLLQLWKRFLEFLRASK